MGEVEGGYHSGSKGNQHCLFEKVCLLPRLTIWDTVWHYINYKDKTEKQGKVIKLDKE